MSSQPAARPALDTAVATAIAEQPTPVVRELLMRSSPPMPARSRGSKRLGAEDMLVRLGVGWRRLDTEQALCQSSDMLERWRVGWRDPRTMPYFDGGVDMLERLKVGWRGPGISRQSKDRKSVV